MYLNMEKMMFWRVEKTACLVGVFVCIFLVKVRLLFYFCKCFSCKKTSFTFSFFSWFYSLSLSAFPFLLFVYVLFFSYLCMFIIA